MNKKPQSCIFFHKATFNPQQIALWAQSTAYILWKQQHGPGSFAFFSWQWYCNIATGLCNITQLFIFNRSWKNPFAHHLICILNLCRNINISKSSKTGQTKFNILTTKEMQLNRSNYISQLHENLKYIPSHKQLSNT